MYRILQSETNRGDALNFSGFETLSVLARTNIITLIIALIALSVPLFVAFVLPLFQKFKGRFQ